MKKKYWEVVPDNPVEVLPLNDIMAHEKSTDCPCFPKVGKRDDGVLIIVHNSFDGRECKEAKK